MDRASASGAEGRVFESRRARGCIPLNLLKLQIAAAAAYQAPVGCTRPPNTHEDTAAKPSDHPPRTRPDPTHREPLHDTHRPFASATATRTDGSISCQGESAVDATGCGFFFLLVSVGLKQAERRVCR